MLGLMTRSIKCKVQISPYSRPNPLVEHSLVIELPVSDRNVKKSLPDIQRLLQVVVVVGAPEAGEDGGDVERPVSHDVELFAVDSVTV